MATIFDAVSTANPQRSTFDLSHDRKYTVKGGYLHPILAKEVVPGDKFTISTQNLIRLIPMVGPTMHKIDMDIHAFFVPNRIIWKNWEKFITGSRLAGAEAGEVPVHPYLDIIEISREVSTEYFKTGSLADDLGYPVTDIGAGYVAATDKTIKVNSLPMRAYRLIWQEYYRDQNLQESESTWDEIFQNDGNDRVPLESDSLYGKYLRRCWEKDYFTSALPFVQKGDPITIPIAGQANIIRKTFTDDHKDFRAGSLIGGSVGTSDSKLQNQAAITTSNSDFQGFVYDNESGHGATVDVNPHNFLADLTGATASTINELRAAFQAQLWLEKNARAGTRYIESLEAHFGVRPADYRLQRPELFGATRVPVTISEVLQTSETATSPQGNMAGHGIGFGRETFDVFCPEHGWIILIASIKPRTSYMYAVSKSIFRLNYLDYYWPEFARLGEQAILRKELGWNIDLTAGQVNQLELEFGYQSRYAEYRSAFSTVHGGMRKDLVLKSWHMARENVNFQSNLSEDFVTADPTDRIFADTEAEYEYICHTQFNIHAKRPMPYFADPGLIDHQG